MAVLKHFKDSFNSIIINSTSLAIINFSILTFVIFFGTSLPFQERLNDAYEAETTNPINQIVFLYLFVGSLIVLIKNLDIITQVIRSEKFLSLFILTCLISFTWSDYPFLSFKRAFQLTVTYLTVLNTISIISERKIIAVLLTIGIFYAFISLISSLLIPEAIDPAFGTWRGIEPSKNGLGYNALMLLIIAFYSSTVQTNYIFKFFFRSLILISMILIIFAFSTTNIIGMILVLLTLSLYKVRFLFQPLGTGKFIFNSMLLLFLTLAVLFSIFSRELLAAVPGIFGKDTSLTGRDIIWVYIGNEILKRPVLGYGYGTYWIMGTHIIDLFTAYVGWRVNEAHNGFLEILLQLGVVGFTFLVLTLFSFIKNTFKYDDKIALIAILSILLVNFSESFIFTPRDPSTLLFMLLYLLQFRKYILISHYHFVK